MNDWATDGVVTPIPAGENPWLPEKKGWAHAPEGKSTNPKDAIGSTKAPLSLVSAVAIAHEAMAMAEGGCKYGLYNYRAIGVRASIYLDAALRHLSKWQNGEECDPDTGVHHLGSARACLGIILDAAAMGKLTDDRPPANPAVAEIIDGLSGTIKNLKSLFTDKNPKHYTISDPNA